jgi:chromosome partitioning related protein ParA
MAVTRTFAALNSKGGVGKTTLLANLGGLLADMGARTLLIDADPQDALTKYYALEYEAPHGIVEVVQGGTATPLAISRTTTTNLHLIRSNDGEAELQHWLHGRADRRSRLARALNNPYITDNYDYILIDTQGAIGPLQSAAAFAANTLISPLPPDTPSVREFRSGTLRVLQRLEQDIAEPRAELAPIKAVICRFDYTRDATSLLSELAKEFTEGDKVAILKTVIPAATAYKVAFSGRVPVHMNNRARGSRSPSPYEVMHRVMWELEPDLYGIFAGGLRGDPEKLFSSPDEKADSQAAASGA